MVTTEGYTENKWHVQALAQEIRQLWDGRLRPKNREYSQEEIPNHFWITTKNTTTMIGGSHHITQIKNIAHHQHMPLQYLHSQKNVLEKLVKEISCH